MNVTLLTHSRLSEQAKELLSGKLAEYEVTDAQVASLAAIRSCYSHKTALEVLETESEKYFGDKGKEGKRLFDHIVKSKHLSTTEHINFSFAVEGVSRALLSQVTRHRQLSFSVQSQRYSSFSSDSRSGGFDYVIPDKIKGTELQFQFEAMMNDIQRMYDYLKSEGIPQEDCRSVLPNAATCNLVTSGNLRAWLEFYNKRKAGNGAQKEASDFAEHIKNAIIEVEPWTKDYFEMES